LAATEELRDHLAQRPSPPGANRASRSRAQASEKVTSPLTKKAKRTRTPTPAVDTGLEEDLGGDFEWAEEELDAAGDPPVQRHPPTALAALGQSVDRLLGPAGQISEDRLPPPGSGDSFPVPRRQAARRSPATTSLHVAYVYPSLVDREYLDPPDWAAVPARADAISAQLATAMVCIFGNEAYATPGLQLDGQLLVLACVVCNVTSASGPIYRPSAPPDLLERMEAWAASAWQPRTLRFLGMPAVSIARGRTPTRISLNLGHSDPSERELDAGCFIGDEGSGLLLGVLLATLGPVPAADKAQQAWGLLRDIGTPPADAAGGLGRDLRALQVDAAQLCGRMEAFQLLLRVPASPIAFAGLARAFERADNKELAHSESLAFRALACLPSLASVIDHTTNVAPQLDAVRNALDSRGDGAQFWIDRMVRHDTTLQEHVKSAQAAAPPEAGPRSPAALRELILGSIRAGSGRPDVPTATDSTAALFRSLDTVLKDVDLTDAHATTVALLSCGLEPVFSALAGSAPPANCHKTLSIAHSLAQQVPAVLRKSLLDADHTGVDAAYFPAFDEKTVKNLLTGNFPQTAKDYIGWTRQVFTHMPAFATIADMLNSPDASIWLSKIGEAWDIPLALAGVQGFGAFILSLQQLLITGSDARALSKRTVVSLLDMAFNEAHLSARQFFTTLNNRAPRHITFGGGPQCRAIRESHILTLKEGRRMRTFSHVLDGEPAAPSFASPAQAPAGSAARQPKAAQSQAGPAADAAAEPQSQAQPGESRKADKAAAKAAKSAAAAAGAASMSTPPKTKAKRRNRKGPIKTVVPMPDGEVRITTGIYNQSEVEAKIGKKLADTCPMLFQLKANDRFEGDLNAQRALRCTDPEGHAAHGCHAHDPIAWDAAAANQLRKRHFARPARN
jgi:hypothetical protein